MLITASLKVVREGVTDAKDGWGGSEPLVQKSGSNCPAQPMGEGE